MSKSKKKIEANSKFKIGESVRVRQGVRDADYPDMPLGGWSGKVVEIHRDGMYTVQWSNETLASIHPVFMSRCEKDGLTVEQYYLDGKDLETDAGGPLVIEQPQEITTTALSPEDQDDRIRMVFNLTSNDPLPDVDSNSLAIYYEYLANRLAFPFAAILCNDYLPPVRVKIIGVVDPNEDSIADEEYGILCIAEIEGSIKHAPLGELDDITAKPCRQLVSDYSYWFHNW